MSSNAKRALVFFVGAMGLVLLLVGAMTHVYPTTVGVILMFVCWIGAGVLAKFWGFRKGES